MLIRSLAAPTLGLLLCACGSAPPPPIGGVVRSFNGQPVSGATVSVEGRPLAATTDKEGRFALDAPPGTYQVEIRRDGFTTEVLRVPLGLGQAFRADDVTLYPLPPKETEGVHWLGPSGPKGLHLARLESRRDGAEPSRTDNWVVAAPASPGAVPAVPTGRNTFEVRSPSSQSEPLLVRVSPEAGGPLVVSRVVSSWGIELKRTESVVPVQTTRVGKEGLLILSVDLQPGLYVWRETTRSGQLVPKPGATGALFRALSDPAGQSRL